MGNTIDKRLIVKNTILLYFRMILTMIVGLYTSRVVLDVLGVEDFGTYNIVAGIVALFSFLNASLSGSSARFITFELGKNETNRIRTVFGASITVHFFLAFAVLFLAETLGVWFLETQLIIPESRIHAARIVYQLSVLSCLVSITQVPYTALIIAHEQMHIYAYMSILEVILKLLIVYLLLASSMDKLILYAILIFLVNIIVALGYRIYCKYKFEECRFRLIFDKKELLPMLSYSSWDLYGNASVVVKDQGLNVLLNIFFGVAINAAAGIANQVQNISRSFVNNFLMAIRPQIVKEYASGNYEYIQQLLMNSAKYSFSLIYIISLPLILENEFILNLWLKNVPEYTIPFCQLCLIINIFSVIFAPVLYLIHAVGRVKMMSFVSGTFFILSLPVSYMFLINGFSPIIPFIVSVLIHLCVSLSYLFVLKKEFGLFSITLFCKKVFVICFKIFSLSLSFSLFIYYTFPVGFWRFSLILLISALLTIIGTYYWVLDKVSKDIILKKIKKKL